jgi:hypothetical protein
MPTYMTVLEIANWVSGLAAVWLMIVASNQAMPEEKQRYHLAARIIGGICLCGISAYGMLFDSRSAIATVQGRVTDIYMTTYQNGDGAGVEFNVEGGGAQSEILSAGKIALDDHYLPVLTSYNIWSAEAMSIQVLEGKQAGWAKAEASKSSPRPLELITLATGAKKLTAHTPTSPPPRPQPPSRSI